MHRVGLLCRRMGRAGGIDLRMHVRHVLLEHEQSLTYRYILVLFSSGSRRRIS